MNRQAALDAAKRAVADRPNSYGNPEQNFERIAALWNAHFGNNDDTFQSGDIYVEATDVAIMLALVKIARLEADPKHADSWIDMAGYAACGAEVSGAAAPPETFHDDMPKPSCAFCGGIFPCTLKHPPWANAQTDKPAQNSDLVDDVLKQAADERRAWNFIYTDPTLSESKFGFTVGETVNTHASSMGRNPGQIKSFTDSRIIVQWQDARGECSGSWLPSELRHGI